MKKDFAGPLGGLAQGLLAHYGLLVLAVAAPTILVVALIGTVLGFW